MISSKLLLYWEQKVASLCHLANNWLTPDTPWDILSEKLPLSRVEIRAPPNAWFPGPTKVSPRNRVLHRGMDPTEEGAVLGGGPPWDEAFCQIF